MWGVSSPHKDLAISVNPGSGACLCVTGQPLGVFTCWVKISGAQVCLPGTVRVEAITVEGMTRGFEHPRKGMVEKEPQGQALWHLLLHSLMDSGASSSVVSEHRKGVTITQGDGESSARTCSSMNVGNSLMHLLNSLTHSANWCSSPSGGGLATSSQCCRAFAYTKVLFWLL